MAVIRKAPARRAVKQLVDRAAREELAGCPRCRSSYVKRVGQLTNCQRCGKWWRAA